MEAPLDLSITELSRITGVSMRNIRYYVEAGVIPRPKGRTRGAKYSQHHIDTLRAYLAARASKAMRQSGQLVLTLEASGNSGTDAVWLELAPDVKVILLPGAAGRTKEELLDVVKAIGTLGG